MNLKFMKKRTKQSYLLYFVMLMFGLFSLNVSQVHAQMNPPSPSSTTTYVGQANQKGTFSVVIDDGRTLTNRYSIKVTWTGSNVTVRYNLNGGSWNAISSDNNTVECDGGTYNFEVTPTATGTTTINLQEQYGRFMLNGKSDSYTFKNVQLKLDLQNGTNGTVAATRGGSNVTTGSNVSYSDTFVFTATPHQYYEVVALTVNGNGVTAGNSYAVSSLNPYTNDKVTVSATYRRTHAKVTASSADANEGSATVTGADAAGYVAKDAVATLQATAKPGYGFVRWTKNGTSVSTVNPYNYTVTDVTSDIAFVAVFDQLFVVNGVVAAGEDVRGVIKAPGSYEVGKGGDVELEATARSDYKFSNWTKQGDATFTSTSNPLSLTNIQANATYIAHFKNVYQVSAGIGTGGGSVTPNTIQQVVEGDAISFTATANPGYQFVNWTKRGDAAFTSTSNPLDLTNVQANAIYFANFLPEYTVTATVAGGINSENPGTALPATQVVREGMQANLSANPAAHYAFVNWTNNVNATKLTNATITPTINSNIAYTANFERSEYNVKAGGITIGGSGGGGTVDKLGNNWVSKTGSITLTAIPYTGHRFVCWWDANDQVIANTITVTVSNPTADVMYRAVFYQTFAITATSDFVVDDSPEPNPNNGGTVAITSVPVANADGRFDIGSNVTLTATPDAANGYYFVEWLKNGLQVGTAGDNVLVVNASEDAAYTALFSRMYDLTIPASHAYNYEILNPERGTTIKWPWGKVFNLEVKVNSNMLNPKVEVNGSEVAATGSRMIPNPAVPATYTYGITVGGTTNIMVNATPKANAVLRKITLEDLKMIECDGEFIAATLTDGSGLTDKVVYIVDGIQYKFNVTISDAYTVPNTRMWAKVNINEITTQPAYDAITNTYTYTTPVINEDAVMSLELKQTANNALDIDPKNYTVAKVLPTGVTGLTRTDITGACDNVTHGGTYSFKINRAVGYDRDDAITVSATMVGGTATITKNTTKDTPETIYTISDVKGNLAITVSDLEINMYDVPVIASVAGKYTITQATQKVAHGANYTFTLVRDAAYTQRTPVVTTTPSFTTSYSPNVVTISNVTNDITDVAITGFENLNTYTVTLPASTMNANMEGYTVSMPTSNTVNYGSNFSFSVTLGVNLDKTVPTVNGATFVNNVGNVYNYTITNITSDKNVTIGTTINTYTITAISKFPDDSNITYIDPLILNNCSAFITTNTRAFNVNYNANSHDFIISNVNTNKYDIYRTGFKVIANFSDGTTRDIVPTICNNERFYFAINNIKADVTFELVLPLKQYTVTVSGSAIGNTDFTIDPKSEIVEYGNDFEFNWTVPVQYSQKTPTLPTTNPNRTVTNTNTVTNADGSKTYTYTISGITSNTTVNVANMPVNTYDVAAPDQATLYVNNASYPRYTTTPSSGSTTVNWNGTYTFTLTKGAAFENATPVFTVTPNTYTVNYNAANGQCTITGIKDPITKIAIAGFEDDKVNTYSLKVIDHVFTAYKPKPIIDASATVTHNGVVGARTVVAYTNKEAEANPGVYTNTPLTIKHGDIINVDFAITDAYSNTKTWAVTNNGTTVFNGVEPWDRSGSFTITGATNNYDVQGQIVVTGEINKYTVSRLVGNDPEGITFNELFPQLGVAWGSAFTFTVTVDEEHSQRIPEMKLNGNVLTETSGVPSVDGSAVIYTYNFNVFADTEISAVDLLPNTYTVTPLAVANNDAIFNPDVAVTVNWGDDTDFVITPATNRHLTSVKMINTRTSAEEEILSTDVAYVGSTPAIGSVITYPTSATVNVAGIPAANGIRDNYEVEATLVQSVYEARLPLTTSKFEVEGIATEGVDVTSNPNLISYGTPTNRYPYTFTVTVPEMYNGINCTTDKSGYTATPFETLNGVVSVTNGTLTYDGKVVETVAPFNTIYTYTVTDITADFDVQIDQSKIVENIYRIDIAQPTGASVKARRFVGYVEPIRLTPGVDTYFISYSALNGGAAHNDFFDFIVTLDDAYTQNNLNPNVTPYKEVYANRGSGGSYAVEYDAANDAHLVRSIKDNTIISIEALDLNKYQVVMTPGSYTLAAVTAEGYDANGMVNHGDKFKFTLARIPGYTQFVSEVRAISGSRTLTFTIGGTEAYIDGNGAYVLNPQAADKQGVKGIHGDWTIVVEGVKIDRHLVSSVSTLDGVPSVVGGTVTPSGSTLHDWSTKPVYTITVNPGYHIKSVVVNGNTITEESILATGDGNFNVYPSYTFDEILGDGNYIAVDFTETLYDINIVVTDDTDGLIINPNVLTGIKVSQNSGAYNFSAQLKDSHTQSDISVVPTSGVVAQTGDPKVEAASYAVTGINKHTTINITNVVRNIYAITVTIDPVDGSGGSVSVDNNNTILHGEDRTYAITPNAGWHASRITVDGVDIVVPQADATGNYPAVPDVVFNDIVTDHTLDVVFAEIEYDITTVVNGNGTITLNPDQTMVAYDGSFDYTVTADAGHHITAITVNGVDVAGFTYDRKSPDTYSATISNVREHQTIEATFAINVYEMTEIANANGKVNGHVGTDVTNVDWHNDYAYTVEADYGYHISGLTVDGVDQDLSTLNPVLYQGLTNGRYIVGVDGQITAVEADHTIEATFAGNVYNVAYNSASDYNNQVNLTMGSFDGAYMFSNETLTVNHGDDVTFDIDVDPAFVNSTFAIYYNNGVNNKQLLIENVTGANLPGTYTINNIIGDVFVYVVIDDYYPFYDIELPKDWRAEGDYPFALMTTTYRQQVAKLGTFSFDVKIPDAYWYGLDINGNPPTIFVMANENVMRDTDVNTDVTFLGNQTYRYTMTNIAESAIITMDSIQIRRHNVNFDLLAVPGAKVIETNLTANEDGTYTVVYDRNLAFDIELEEGVYDESNLRITTSRGELLAYSNGKYTLANVISPVTVTVESLYEVTLPSATLAVDFYEVVPEGLSVSPVAYKGNYSFVVNVDPAYTQNVVVVKVNGVELEAVNGVYTINNITENKTVSVEGINVINTYDINLPTSVYYAIEPYANSFESAEYMDANPATYGSNFSFKVNMIPSHSDAPIVVMANGVKIDADANGVYVIRDIRDIQNVTITGDDVINTYNVTLPNATLAVDFYEVIAEPGSVSPVNYDGSFSFRVNLSVSHNQSIIEVTSNGQVMTAVDGVYTIEGIREHKIVEVTNVAINRYAMFLPEEGVEAIVSPMYQSGVEDGKEVAYVNYDDDFTFSVNLRHLNSNSRWYKIYVDNVQVYGQYYPGAVNDSIYVIPNVRANHVITADVERINSYVVTLLQSPVAQLDHVAGPFVNYDGTYKFSVTVDPAYIQWYENTKVDEIEAKPLGALLLTNGNNVKNIATSVERDGVYKYTYTLENLVADQAIELTGAMPYLNEYTVTVNPATAPAGSAFMLPVSQKVNYGGSYTFRVALENNYQESPIMVTAKYYTYDGNVEVENEVVGTVVSESGYPIAYEFVINNIVANQEVTIRNIELNRKNIVYTNNNAPVYVVGNVVDGITVNPNNPSQVYVGGNYEFTVTLNPALTYSTSVFNVRINNKNVGELSTAFTSFEAINVTQNEGTYRVSGIVEDLDINVQVNNIKQAPVLTLSTIPTSTWSGTTISADATIIPSDFADQNVKLRLTVDGNTSYLVDENGFLLDGYNPVSYPFEISNIAGGEHTYKVEILAMDGNVLREQAGTISAISVDVTQVEGGTIAPEITDAVKNTLIAGNDVTFIFTPDEYRHVKDIKVNGKSVMVYAVANPDGSYNWTLKNVPGDYAIVAEFELDTYLVTAATTNHYGTITPTRVYVGHGSAQEFTIHPYAGYEVTSVSVDGNLVVEDISSRTDYEYTLSNVTSSHHVVADFDLTAYKVTLTPGEGYTLTGITQTAVYYNGKYSFKLEIAPGYHQTADFKVLVNGNVINHIGGVYTIRPIQDDQVVTVEGIEIDTFQITLPTSVVGATVTAIDPTTVNYGSDFRFSVNVDAAYTKSTYSVTERGNTTDYVGNQEITISNVKEDIIVTMTDLVMNTYTITATTPVNGTITPAGVTTVTYGDEITYSIVPRTGYHIVDVIVDGASVGVVSTYTFTNVTDDHTIAATFAINTYTITLPTSVVGATVEAIDPIVVNYGDSFDFSVIVDPAYNKSDYTVKQRGQTMTYSGMVSPRTISLYNITEDVIVEMSDLVRNVYDVAFTPTANVTFTGNSTVVDGDTYNFTVEVAAPYTQQDITILANGVAVANVTETPEGFYTCAIPNVMANQTISIRESVNVLNLYNVAIIPVNGVTVTPVYGSTTPTEYGSSFYFTVAVAPEYDVTNMTVEVDGIVLPAIGNMYQITNITADKTIEIKGVVKDSYNVTLPTVTGLTITPDVSPVAHGASYSFTAVLDAAYSNSNIVVWANNIRVIGANNVYTIHNITADQNVVIEGVVMNTYTVTLPAVEGATVVAVDGYTSPVIYGNEFKFTVNANAGYTTPVVKVNNVVVYPVAGVYTITDVKENKVVTVENARETHTVSFTASTGLTWLPQGTTTVNNGDSFRFGYALDAAYSNAAVKVMIGSTELLPVSGLYTVNNITADITVYALGVTTNNYTVNAVPANGVTITPESGYTANVIYGNDYKFTIAIAPNYNATNMVVKANGNVVNPMSNVYTVANITSNVEITVEGVVLKSYAVTFAPTPNATVNAVNGSVSPVIYNGSYSFTVTLDAAYSQSAGNLVVRANSEQLFSDNGIYTIENITEAQNVTIGGININNYDITLPSVPGATVIPVTDGTIAAYGTNYTFRVELAEAYSNSNITVMANGVALGNVNNTFTIYNVTANQAVVLTGVKMNVYNITLPTVEGVTIAPKSNATVEYGKDYQFTVTPAYGYDVKSITVKANGKVITGVDGTYTITNVTADQSVTVTGVVKQLFTVVLPSVEGLLITPTSSNNVVPFGGSYSFTVIIDPEYGNSKLEVKANGVTVPAIGSTYTINNIQSNQTVTIDGVVYSMFTVTLPTIEGVVFEPITPNYNVAYGESYSFTATLEIPYSNSKLEVKVNGIGLTPKAGVYTINNIKENQVVTANTPVINTYTITVQQSEGGNISPENMVVEYGASHTFYITPNPEFEVVKVLADGMDVGKVVEWTATNVTKDMVITALFMLKDTKGVEDVEAIETKIYSYGMNITVETAEYVENATIQVVDLAGRIITSIAHEDVKTKLEVPVQGAYVVRVFANEAILKTQKVIVK